VNVNLGSHADQAANAPLSYSATLVLSRTPVTCPLRASLGQNVYGDPLRGQGIDFLFMLTSTALVTGSAPFAGFSFDAGTNAANSVDGAVNLTSIATQNLPNRDQASFDSLGFPQIGGSLSGTVSTTTGSWFDSEPFTAEHCAAFDSVSGE
jgi:hypothetical protein